MLTKEELYEEGLSYYYSDGYSSDLNSALSSFKQALELGCTKSAYWCGKCCLGLLNKELATKYFKKGLDFKDLRCEEELSKLID